MTENKGNLIRREALKNDISEKACDKFEKWNKLITLAEFETFIRDIIDDAPTIEPEITEKQAIIFLINNGWLVNHDKELREKWERPKGELIVILNALGETKYQCNQCQHYVKPSDDKNFCPNCGADLRKGGDNA